MKVQVKDIQLDQFAELEKRIRSSNISIAATQETWKSLHEFFKSSSVVDDKKYFFTYFRLYVELTFKFFSVLERDEVILAIKRQVPTALLLEFDVWGLLMSYLGVHTIDQYDMADFYSQIRNDFLNSGAIVGKFQGKDVMVRDLIADVGKMSNQKMTSLERASAVNRIRDIFASVGQDNVSKYFTEDVFAAVNHFIDLVKFFSEVTPDQIYNLVYLFMHPEIAERTEQPAGGEMTSLELETTMTKIERKPVETIVAPPQALVNPPRAKKETEAKVEKVKPMSYREMKEQIENQFKKDQGGQFMNISEVLNELERLAAKYEDDRIRDLYIYSETDGRFEWNEKLING